MADIGIELGNNLKQKQIFICCSLEYWSKEYDLDELPVIHPPKRRRLQKLNMQETAIRSNLDSDRIRLELPLHNWLEHKIKLGTESTKTSSENVQEESGNETTCTKKKSEKHSKKVKPVSPDTKLKDTKDLKDSETSKLLCKESDVLPDNAANAVTPSHETSSTEKSDVWRKQLALSRSKSQSKQNVSNCTDKENDFDNKQEVEDIQENNVEVQELVLSSTPLVSPKTLKPAQDVNTNFKKSPVGDDILQSDDLSLHNLDKVENSADGQLVADETPTSQKKSDQNVPVPSLQNIEDTDIKQGNVNSELEMDKSTENAIEEERSNPDFDNHAHNLTTNVSDVNQPLDLCLKVSQDTPVKPVSQKPQPKVQLVHPQVISSTAKKKEEHTNLLQTTKMAIQSITSSRTPFQNDHNTSDEASNVMNQESQVNVSPQVEVCDFSMKTKSNINSSSQIHQESHQSNTIICLPATSDHEMTPGGNTPPASSKKLPDDLEFQHHIEELRHLERLARKKEQEHAQVLALSRKKVETIMKLKLQKKRAAALNLSTLTFDKEHEVQLDVSASNSSPGSSSSEYLATNAVTGKENPGQVVGHSCAEAEKGENTDTSNDSHCKINVGSNEHTSKDNKSEDMRTMTGRITEALQQAVQNKTIKNPNSENDKQITPQPAHQRVKSTLPHDEPCKLPNDASSLCPFRLRSDSLTDPSINPTKKSMDKPIQEAHNQPAFQPAGSLIVPNIPISQKESLGYNYSGVNESNKSRTLEYKRTQSYNKEDELNKQKNEVIDLTIETSSVLNDPPPLKRIKRDEIMEMPPLHSKGPLINHNLLYDESTSRQILRSPNQRVTATSNSQEVIQPVPRYQIKASSYSHSPPVYQQNLVPSTASSTPPVQNRLHYDRSSPYSRGASPQALYPMRPGLPNPMMRLPNVPTFSPQIRPEQQMQKQIHHAPFPPVPQNNPYGHLEPGEIITNRFPRGWHHPSQINAAPNQHMPEVAERRMFPGQHSLSPHVLKQIMTQQFLQQPMQRIPAEQSHHPSGQSGPYRAPIYNASQKVFSPHGMAQPLHEPMKRSNDIQQQYSGSQTRPVTSIIENNRACCVCNKVSCFICSGCRKVWYCSYQCQVDLENNIYDSQDQKLKVFNFLNLNNLLLTLDFVYPCLSFAVE
ncbi:hypothetical protein LOTGIDRAFT_228212 [Lottia gigantea]|uniref:MYND-type domain-containing protein n=1 Tax=Lottia gigantea TaxID=225164 RepID=V4AKC3_LOTGI|nr:hypothetical protein LOTGIDRAFT_228212 [Lottia gigantea]ESO97552.1 hypothetical protein LOTGIDRAFT_228212 [Lottia gigantea]